MLFGLLSIVVYRMEHEGLGRVVPSVLILFVVKAVPSKRISQRKNIKENEGEIKKSLRKKIKIPGQNAVKFI